MRIATISAKRTLPLDGGDDQAALSPGQGFGSRSDPNLIMGGGERLHPCGPLRFTPPPTPPHQGEGSEQAIWAVLDSVPDPEIPVVSVVELGIVREVRADRVTITPTYTGCPATQVIESDIRAALDAAGFRDLAIETTLSPPWTTDWITESGKAKLQAYGIAPPSRAATATCPQCGAADTEELSRFGSTPCKAQMALPRCLDRSTGSNATASPRHAGLDPASIRLCRG